MNLTQREKHFIIVGMVLLGLIVAFQLLVKPALSRARTLRRVVAEKRQGLIELQAKSSEYSALRRQLDQICRKMENQEKDWQILSFVEGVQKDCDLMSNVVYVKPTRTPVSDQYEQTQVEVKFDDVTLVQLIQFLAKIESSDSLVSIRELDIKRRIQNPGTLDAVVRVATLSAID